MGNIRTPAATQNRINEIKNIKDTKLALESIVDLLLNYTKTEEAFPVKYDPDSGVPVKYEWKPSPFHPKFDMEIYLGGEGLRDPEPGEPRLAYSIIEEIKRKPLLVNTQFGKYVFFYEERDASSSEPMGSGTYYATRRSIFVREVEELKNSIKKT